MTYRRTDLSDEARRALLANLANQYWAIEEMTDILCRAIWKAAEAGLRDQEIADRLGVSRATAGRWRKKGAPNGPAPAGDQGTGRGSE